MVKIIVWSFLAGLAFHLNGVETIPKGGPFDIVIQRLEQCEDEGTGQIRFDPRINSKGNRLYTYTNPVNISIPWDKDFKVNVDMQQLSNGVYRPRFMTHTFKGCENIMKVAKTWAVSFFAAAGYNFTDCPVPAGVYYVKDWVVEVKADIPTMMYGSYKAILDFFWKGKRVGCLIIYGEVVPK